MTETLTAPPPTDETLAAWAKALAHPARIQILRTLANSGTCICGQIVDVLPLAQSTVSQHLKVLREAGLVCGEADGTRTCYCVDAAALDLVRTAFADFLGGLSAPPPCCS